MKISSDANRYAYKSLQGLAPASQIVSLCCLLVLVNLSINWISFKECSSFFYLVPLLLLLVIFKLIWDNNNRVYSIGAVLLTTFAFAILYSNVIETHYQQQLRFFYNILQRNTGANERFSLSTEVLSNQMRDEEWRDAKQTKSFSSALLSADSIQDSDALNIFFIETSYKKEVLTNRELCAIESAAKHNPNAKVFVLTMRAQLKSNTPNQLKAPDLVEKYSNLALLRLNPLVLFNSTPLFEWWKKGSWSKSPYIFAHLSDAARLALLWKYGGFYSDLDTITIKDLTPVSTFSSVGHMVESGSDSMGNGVMSFERAHPLLKQIMTSFEKNYDPSEWGGSGPVLVESEMKKYCRNEEIYKSQLVDEDTFEKLVAEHKSSPGPKWETFKYSNSNSSSTKCDILIYPSSFYYPYNYRQELKEIFETNSKIPISRLIDTYSVHFYGKFSSEFHVNIGDKSLYEYLAKSNCPNVYARVKKERAKFD